MVPAEAVPMQSRQQHGAQGPASQKGSRTE